MVSVRLSFGGLVLAIACLSTTFLLQFFLKDLFLKWLKVDVTFCGCIQNSPCFQLMSF